MIHKLYDTDCEASLWELVPLRTIHQKKNTPQWSSGYWYSWVSIVDIWTSHFSFFGLVICMVFWLFMIVFLQMIFFSFFFFFFPPQHAVEVCSDILEVHTSPSSEYLNLVQVKATVIGRHPSPREKRADFTGSFNRMLPNQNCGMGDRAYIKPNMISQFQEWPFSGPTVRDDTLYWYGIRMMCSYLRTARVSRTWTHTHCFLSFFLWGNGCDAFTVYLAGIHLPGLHC